MTYHVITAEVGGRLLTGLVDEYSWKEDSDPTSYFLPKAENVTHQGTVEIEGEAQHMIPSYLIEGYET